tara:strand:+ start:41 stop:214 length:174 start_codon:yes stop_codon:yes gene_type:complete
MRKCFVKGKQLTKSIGFKQKPVISKKSTKKRAGSHEEICSFNIYITKKKSKSKTLFA